MSIAEMDIFSSNYKVCDFFLSNRKFPNFYIFAETKSSVGQLLRTISQFVRSDCEKYADKSKLLTIQTCNNRIYYT